MPQHLGKTVPAPAEDPTRKSSEEETRGWKEEEGIFAVAAVAVIIISLSDAQ